MQRFDPQDTQPTRINNVRPIKITRESRNLRWIVWILLAGTTLILSSLVGIAGGYRSGILANQDLAAAQSLMTIQDQYELALKDYQSGKFDLARQRFEYVLSKDPVYPGAVDKLAEVIQILNATATPTSLPSTPTLTPTPDLRPIEDLVNEAKSFLMGANWTGAIDTIVNLRKVNPSYRVVEVDGFLYLALRNRGVDKIKAGDLEGGIYDLTLSERFGPLDAEAINFRELARLYMYGSAFWEAYPEQAVYYFSQVAAAAPRLHDASGWTAGERYRASLIQFGDQLAKTGNWCEAYTQYDLAASMGGDAAIIPTSAYAREQCYPPTATATAVPTETFTPTLLPTPLATDTPTAGISPTVEVSPTQSPPTDTVTPEVTQPSVSTETNTPEVLPTSTETPTMVPLTPTETSQPASFQSQSATPETIVVTATP